MSLIRLRSLARDRRGNATLELVAFASFSIVLILGGADLVGYMRSRLRVDQVAAGVANLVTEYDQLYVSDFNTVFQAAQTMAGGLAVGGEDGATIVTGLTNPSGTPLVAWRQRTGNAGFASRLGAVGGAPTNLPDNYVVPTGSSVIGVEVFTSVHPWVFSAPFTGSSGDPTLRGVALFQPRASLLSTVSAGTRP